MKHHCVRKKVVDQEYLTRVTSMQNGEQFNREMGREFFKKSTNTCIYSEQFQGVHCLSSKDLKIML